MIQFSDSLHLSSEMNHLKSYQRRLISWSLILLSLMVLSSCSSEEERMKQYQEQTIEKAWKQEQELVSLGHSGTFEWSETEKAELLQTGKVKGYEGQYISKNFEENSRLATNSNNIVFIKSDSSYPSEAALKLAPLRSYLITYEKKKYYLWAGFVLSLIVLILAIKHKRGIIMYPALAGAFFGTIRLGILSGWAIMATFGGLASGLIAGTITGLFLFLIFLSLGIG
jgi:uncharacterized membrane protein